MYSIKCYWHFLPHIGVSIVNDPAPLLMDSSYVGIHLLFVTIAFNLNRKSVLINIIEETFTEFGNQRRGQQSLTDNV